MVTKSINAFALSSAILGTVALTACSSGDDEPGTNAPAPASSDSTEAKTPTTKGADLVDNTPAAGDPSLGQKDVATKFVPLLNWSFESASPDCNGWPVVGANASIRAIPAKSGSYSCKVCSNGSGVELGLSQKIKEVAKGHYTLSAYVRKRAQTAAPSQAIARINGKTIITSNPVDVREEWDRITASIDVEEDTKDLSITIGSDNAETDHCLFIDDIVFTRD